MTLAPEGRGLFDGCIYRDNIWGKYDGEHCFNISKRFKNLDEKMIQMIREGGFHDF